MVPMTTGVAHPHRQTGTGMRTTIHGNDARLMDHFLMYDDGVRSLEDQIAIVVRRWKHAPWYATGNTPLPRAMVLPGVCQVHQVVIPSGFGLRPDRHASIRRHDDYGFAIRVDWAASRVPIQRWPHPSTRPASVGPGTPLRVGATL